MPPTTLNETIERQALYTSATFLANLKDITDAEALQQPDTGGNSLNWVAGHVVLYRITHLGMLGGESPVSREKYARYQRQSEPVTAEGEGVLALGEMIEDWVALRQPFFTAIRAADTPILEKAAAFSPLNDPEETVGSLAAGLLFHESYHIGQLGILRRLVGKDGAIR